MHQNLDTLKSKIVTKEILSTSLARWRFKERKIVFTNGCFDIIHRGHIEYLAKAADLGDILIIGLNSDASVKRLKGSERPINDENSRAIVLASLQFVDIIILFNEDTPYETVKLVKPDIITKGGDYSNDEIVGADIVLKRGGQVINLDFVDGFSSTALINKIVGDK